MEANNHVIDEKNNTFESIGVMNTVFGKLSNNIGHWP